MLAPAASAPSSSWKVLRAPIGSPYTYQTRKHHLPLKKGGEGPQGPHLLISMVFWRCSLHFVRLNSGSEAPHWGSTPSLFMLGPCDLQVAKAQQTQHRRRVRHLALLTQRRGETLDFASSDHVAAKHLPFVSPFTLYAYLP